MPPPAHRPPTLSRSPLPIEPRWPAMLAVLAMGALLVGLPNRFRLLPVGLAWAVTTVGFLPLLAVGLSGGRRRWLGIERRLLWVFVVTVMGLSVANLSQLIRLMLFGGDRLGAIELLASGGALWVTNVVVFAVTYWHADRGGPEARRQSAPAGADLDRAPASQAPGNWPDWHFPQQDFRELAGDWWPSFLDYLFLSYCTATAFSPTGAVPLTARSQLLMLAQSAISLITLALIAARAINILGS